MVAAALCRSFTLVKRLANESHAVWTIAHQHQVCDRQVRIAD
jgi:hypothetical protein